MNDDKAFQELLQRGREAIERSKEALSRVQEAAPGEPDEFSKKLTQASTAILDRIIEQNKPQPIEMRPSQKTKSKLRLAKNLERLCEECGWNPYQLHKQTRIDKGLVLGHFKGKGCSLQNLKKYADAFSQALNRKVSIADLEA